MRSFAKRVKVFARVHACSACGPAAFAAVPRSSLNAAYTGAHLLRPMGDSMFVSLIVRPTKLRNCLTASKGSAAASRFGGAGFIKLLRDPGGAALASAVSRSDTRAFSNADNWPFTNHLEISGAPSIPAFKLAMAARVLPTVTGASDATKRSRLL
ncbi:hypothetical protein D3C86_1534810 [compost metagenome]